MNCKSARLYSSPLYSGRTNPQPELQHRCRPETCYMSSKNAVVTACTSFPKHQRLRSLSSARARSESRSVLNELSNAVNVNHSPPKFNQL